MSRVNTFRIFALALLCAAPLRAAAPAQSSQDNDQTLRAMRDEMARSKTRLELKIPGTEQPVRPYYVEYRLLDLDVREIVAEFGTLLTTTRNQFYEAEFDAYAYARYLLLYLQEQGKLTAFYERFVADKKDPTGKSALENILGEKLETFEPRWRKWAVALKSDNR